MMAPNTCPNKAMFFIIIDEMIIYAIENFWFIFI